MGEAAINPGIIFTDEDNVIPDVVGASAVLTLVITLQSEDALTSPLLPEFSYPLSRIFDRR